MGVYFFRTSTLARNLRQLRGLIFRVTKDQWLNDVRRFVWMLHTGNEEVKL